MNISIELWMRKREVQVEKIVAFIPEKVKRGIYILRAVNIIPRCVEKSVFELLKVLEIEISCRPGGHFFGRGVSW